MPQWWAEIGLHQQKLKLELKIKFHGTCASARHLHHKHFKQPLPSPDLRNLIRRWEHLNVHGWCVGAAAVLQKDAQDVEKGASSLRLPSLDSQKLSKST